MGQTMNTQPDMEKVKKRYEAWWQGEVVDRCMLWVTAPSRNAGTIKPPEVPSDLFERYFSIEHIHAQTQHFWKTHYFAGDSFPTWPDGDSACLYHSFLLNDQLSAESGTFWQSPILTGDEIDYNKLKFNSENTYWKFAIELYKFAAKQAQESGAIPLIHGYHSVSDDLASYRGNERLLLDLMERPDAVRDAELYLSELSIAMYDEMTKPVENCKSGYTSWLKVWAPQNFSMLQHDFAYMISPEMHKDIFLPALEKQIDAYEYNLIHVDGIGNFSHVPALCEIDKLKAIQLAPGAGKPSALHYVDVLKQIQLAGKGIYLAIDSNDVERALEILSPNGLMIATACNSADEADALVKKVEKLSARKIRKFHVASTFVSTV